MKKIYTLIAIVVTSIAFAQVPQGISYQAIAMDNSGNPVVSANVGLRLSILDNSATGTVLYTETHNKTTNAQGLYNLVIGQGTPTVGTFSGIKWENGSKFLKIEMDAAGGTTYVLVGSTELLSVPYALYAGKVNAEDVVGGPDSGDSISTWYTSSFMTDTNAYVFSRDLRLSIIDSPTTWHSTPIIGTPFMKSVNSFMTSTNVYIFSPDSNSSQYNWHTFPISGQPIKIVSLYGITIAVTSTNAYAFNTYNDSTPVPVTLSGTFIDIASSASHIGILTSTNAYVYGFIGANVNPPTYGWSSIPISGNPLKIKYTMEGIFVLTSTNAYHYGVDNYLANNVLGGTFVWNTIPISGDIKLD